MSKKLRINTREGLEQFLSIIAEESVAKATEEMRQSDTAKATRPFTTSKPSKKPEIQDEEDDELFGGKPEKSDKKKEEPAEEKPKPEKKDEERPKPDAPDKITFTMIKDKVNTIRSGRSLRDDEIRGELKDYFNELTGDEQEALFAFLDGISQVLTAGIEGEEATDPSKSPHNLKVTAADSEEGEVKEKPKKSPVKKAQPSGKKDIEDTSPPIDVGKKQRTEAIRRHIRALMG